MTHWWERAACAGSDVNLFYPETGETMAPGLSVCRRCPVRKPCLREAVDRNDHYGIWGGTTPRDRDEKLPGVSGGE